VRKKTNLNISPGPVIFAKTYPENRQILSIYYSAKVLSGREKPGDKFTELAWVKPEELKKYFTTSLHPELYRIINKLK
jgi:hypothetical protein